MEKLSFEQLVEASVLVDDFCRKTNDMDSNLYYAIVATMIEERCKAEGEDVRERMRTLVECANEVVAEYGVY